MKHTYIFFKEMFESVQKDGRRHDYPISHLQVYKDYLTFSRSYVGHPHYKNIEYHLFPNENIGIYKLSYNMDGELPKNLYRYYVDMVRVEKHEDFWDIKDLYIDFIIKLDGHNYVVDIDEFSEACSRKELDQTDSECALHGLDSVLKTFYESFDMEVCLDKLRALYGDSANSILEYALA